jgi:hypothetical protein
MVDAQLTNARVLKPVPNFANVYQGKPASTPIAFPGTRDPRAEENAPGFSPNLMKGIAVPEGARVLLWFPICWAPLGTYPNPLVPFQFYSYRLIWRYQNLGSYRNPAAKQRRAPYHFPRQSPGAPETIVGVPVPRVTIPASWHVIAYEQTEPATGAGNLIVRQEQITPRLDSLSEFVQPLLPDGQPGVVQQGVLDPTATGGGQMPIFVPFWTDAEGDELIILANRSDWQDPNPAPWDFTSGNNDPLTPPQGDLAFSNIYGTGDGRHESFRDLGIYMQTGTTP